MVKIARPKKEFDKKQFVDLIGIGCQMDEICWWFRDETGKPANIDTLSRWCKREFGLNFQEYRRKNGAMALKIKLRNAQMKLAEKSAAMAIFLGKNYLNQRDKFDFEANVNENVYENMHTIASLINHPVEDVDVTELSEGDGDA